MIAPLIDGQYSYCTYIHYLELDRTYFHSCFFLLQGALYMPNDGVVTATDLVSTFAKKAKQQGKQASLLDVFN